MLKLKPPNKFIARAPHHLYIGIVIIFFGWLMDPWEYYSVWTTLFYIVGSYVFIDDFIEHTATASTPLRWFFDKILFPFMKYFNDLFKKR